MTEKHEKDTTRHNQTQGEIDNTKPQSGRFRAWGITINNPTDNEEKKITKQEKYLYQIEHGEHNTRHIQGMVKYKNARTFKTMKNKFPRAHIEPIWDQEGYEKYCTKTETRTAGPYSNYYIKVIDPFDEKKAKKWQLEILKIISKEPDNRTIHWYWESEGCSGKTTIAKHICMNYQNAIYVGGKANDIKCAIAAMKIYPKIVILGIPRSKQTCSYTALEEVKDGIFFNGKYESGMIIGNCPHIIVLSNYPPDEDKLSKDRWKITQISNE